MAPEQATARQQTATRIIIALFIIIAATRIIIAYQSPHPDYDGYLPLRQVESIHQTGLPLFEDELSYGGRARVFSPLYTYLIALFGLVLPKLWLVKVLPNLFAAAIVIPAYAFARILTKHEGLAIITAGMTGLIPALFLIGINDGSPITLSITLLVTTMYLFIKSRKSGKHLDWLLIALVALILLHPLSLVFLIGLLLYTALLRVQSMKISPKDVELLLFTLFFTAWFSLVVFKKAFVMHGSNVIWQNIPAMELSAVFSKVTLLSAISSTGFIALILGVGGLYYGLTETKRKSIVFLTGMVAGVVILIWFRLIALRTGLALLGILLALASGYALHRIVDYLRKTKAARLAWAAVAGIIAIFVIATLPSMLTTELTDTPTAADIEVLTWADEHLSEDAIIMGAPIEGNLIAGVAHRKNVMDTDYLLIPRVEERYEDTITLYKSFFKIDAVSILQKYGATHVYVSPQTEAFTDVAHPRFLDDEQCFSLVKTATDGTVQLYGLTCSLRGEEYG
ncbi:hypothetical protein GF367_03125 [Candidatus Woesearchaeota archaeon]|nr:hypothetical protein [Candidatus Woesearchaeota archaeon]